jgi:flagellar motor switch/type III secretory pathway protein FliN
MAEAITVTRKAIPSFSPDLWDEVGWLDCEVTVELPVPGFAVRNLLQLTVGSIVESQWNNGDDMPLRAAKRQIGWVEFEAMGEFLAVRLTELV